MDAPRPYWNPYLAGLGLGLTLLLSFLVLGTGLGASGAITRIAADSAHAVLPSAVEGNAYLADFFDRAGPLHHYLVFLLAGTVLGGFLSAAAARRVRVGVERGPRIGALPRLGIALGGGALVGIGGRFAMGCTSGQALTGGALLQVGGLVFTAATFASAFLVAPLVRKEWR